MDKCDRCGEPATTEFNSVVNGKKFKSNLCDNCMSKQVSGFSSGLVDHIDKEIDQVLGGIGPTCECGCTIVDIQNNKGRLGCPKCYETFDNVLEDMFLKCHRGTEHIGRLPKSIQDQAKKNILADLEKRMKTAVSTENYEEAAKIRDRIKEL
jgi:protein arginine kinase activator